MDDKTHDQPDTPSLDDPVRRARVVKALAIATPLLFVGSYLLAWVQGAQATHAFLIAAIAAVGCAATAIAIHTLGSKSRYLLVLLTAALSLAKMKR